MSNVVGGISVSHAPGILGWPDQVTPEEHARVFGAFDRLRDSVIEARPDVIIAFLDDHFDNHYRTLMPSLTVAVADEHTGPGEQYLDLLKLNASRTIPSSASLAELLLERLVGEGFDVARMGAAEFGNNLMVPLELIRPECDIPVIPVFINVFTPPLITMKRAYDLGAAVRKSAADWPRRVMFWGTGGLSHWPPFWSPNREEDDAFLRRMRRYQTDGRRVLEEDPDLFTDVGPYEIEMARHQGDAVVNPTWDRAFVEAVGRGDMEHLTSMTYAQIEQDAGHGGHEVLNWMAVAGAMGGVPGEILAYAPTPEWICGTGAIRYAAP
jgi:2,3-dihydroxyphenylpropionate 1,2-dioxygenase